MRLFLYFLFLQAVTAQTGFGRSYLGNSKLCQEWSCINTKMNLTDSLPSKEQYGVILKSLFSKDWQNILDSALDICYGKKPKRYTNTCPGQAIMHCVMDQVVMNCPISSLTTDSCTQLSSLAGHKYMFSQSRYENLEENLKKDRRPPEFLRKYFHTTCCNIPDVFEDEILKECGFEKFMFYHVHEVQSQKPGEVEFHTMIPVTSTKGITYESLHDENVNEVSTDEPQDPLDCCDMSAFIDPLWKSECGFHLKWDVENRLTIINSELPTTTTAPLRDMDIKVVPVSCDAQQCIFDKLEITSSGKVDSDKFAQLLDNMTNREPVWNTAKTKVLSHCLRTPLTGYDSECEINKILGCTFDVLSENCPYENKKDLCQHSTDIKEGVICQISASKYRPKNRRQFCNIPDIVKENLLASCGVSSIYKIEYVQSKDTQSSSGVRCKESTVSSNCVMNKMGVLNKYGFIDYFKMKDKIRSYSEGLTASLYDLYTSAFLNTPYYQEHCSSSKKLLNVIDSLLLTCPSPNRKKTKQCDKFFTELKNTIANNVTREKLDDILRQFKTYYLPTNAHKDIVKNTKTNPLYDFGILSSNGIPAVKVIDVKPSKPRTLVILPVYQRMKNNTIFSLNNDGIYRG